MLTRMHVRTHTRAVNYVNAVARVRRCVVFMFARVSVCACVCVLIIRRHYYVFVVIVYILHNELGQLNTIYIFSPGLDAHSQLFALRSDQWFSRIKNYYRQPKLCN